MASIAIIVVWFIVTMYVMPDHHKLANDPDNLEKITGIDFPEYTITYTTTTLIAVLHIGTVSTPMGCSMNHYPKAPLRN